MTAAGRAAFIAGLRKLADAIERDEGIPLPYHGTSTDIVIYTHHITGEELAGIVRSLGGTGWRQYTTASASSVGTTTWLKVAGNLAGLKVEVAAEADEVCRPISPQPVIERHCPALDEAIADAEAGNWGAS